MRYRGEAMTSPQTPSRRCWYMVSSAVLYLAESGFSPFLLLLEQYDERGPVSLYVDKFARLLATFVECVHNVWRIALQNVERTKSMPVGCFFASSTSSWLS
ncbi:uncharacterized protein ATNIH1004_003679 [Aspergillus tanneri]|uniref:Uncharacterized protein n=1 Tax=Aspergillus tanneri TaxID=1220188 RepID=A0A5M9MVS4_9EURO|nr:uncharacterized protein ATNIH1004_003679 [Aspergillus tanneri]KAA8650988.1 hypothetical protein ATNIH1004_003679 [Aspergillus tanneri]